MSEYIEREALKREFAKRLDTLWAYMHDERSCVHYACCKEDMELIDEAPNADVAPVAHGRWISGYGENGAFSVCDQCEALGYRKARYCPNCGAKMDKADKTKTEDYPSVGLSDV